jgi:hypothetical protein
MRSCVIAQLGTPSEMRSAFAFTDCVIASDRAERVDGDAAVSDHDDDSSLATFEVDECGDEAVRCVERGVASRRLVGAIIRRSLPLGHELIETDARTVIPVHALGRRASVINSRPKAAAIGSAVSCARRSGLATIASTSGRFSASHFATTAA